MIPLLALLLVTSVAQLPPPTPRPAPHTGTWQVEVVDRIKILPSSRVVMTIGPGTISGSASCNSFRGPFTVHAGRVTVGELLKTMKACDPARMSEEKDFFAFLPLVTTLDVRDGDTLVLTTHDGRNLTARRVAPEPVQR